VRSRKSEDGGDAPPVSWRRQVRGDQDRRKRRFLVASTLFVAGWFVATGLAAWAHYVVLGPLSGERFAAILVGLGTAGLFVLGSGDRSNCPSA
jgi:hypothetical protein